MSRRFRSHTTRGNALELRQAKAHQPGITVESLEDRMLLSGLGASASASNPSFGQLPLFFEMNQGQTHDAVKFISRGDGYAVFLAPQEAVLSLRGDAAASAADSGGVDVIRMQLHGSNPAPSVVGLDDLIGRSNYLIGNDPQGWVSGVPQFSKVRYDDVYPGVDLLFYGNQRELEYDFIVSPGADPNVIEFGFAGVTAVTLDGAGNLVLSAHAGDLIQRRPVLFQEISGERSAIDGAFRLLDDGSVKFQVGIYDPTLPLIIDPVLSYSTYVGGTGGDGTGAIAVDAAGNLYIAGSTTSRDFPSQTKPGVGAAVRPVQPTRRGSGDSNDGDAVVMKLDPTGTTVIYSTYLGGSAVDWASSIAIDNSGNAYLTGYTTSRDFPTSLDAFDRTYDRGELVVGDAFVTKLDSAGASIVYSTYLGGGNGKGGESGNDIAVDDEGFAYVTGSTGTVDFPTKDAVQSVYAGGLDAFVTKVNQAGTGLVFSTYLGGSSVPHDFDTGTGIDVDSAGNVYVVGGTYAPNFPVVNAFQSGIHGPTDGFLAKFSAVGELLYSSYIGGSSFDSVLDVTLDASGNVYMTGVTHSTDFPTAGAIQPERRGVVCAGERAGSPCSDAFVLRMNANGQSLDFSTYLGGTYDDYAQSIAIDDSGSVYVAGTTYSPDFPTVDAVQSTLGGIDRCWTDVEIQVLRCDADAFVTKLSARGAAIEYSTFLGGSFLDVGSGIAVDTAGNAYVAGSTVSHDFPVINALQPTHVTGGRDGYVAKLATAPLPPQDPSVSSVAAQTTTSEPTADGPTELGRSAGPSGNVIAAVIGGRLLIYGDMADNEVRIEMGTSGLGSIKLTPGAGTTINGHTDSVEFARIRKGMRIRMGGGSDTLVFDASARPFQIPGKIDLRTDSLDSVQAIDTVLAHLFRGTRSARRGTNR